MNKLTALLFFCFPLFSMGQSGFTVEASLKGLGDNKVKISFMKDGKFALDTLGASAKDLVIWKGNTQEPQLVRMEVMDSTLNLKVGKAVATPPALQFLLANTNIAIQGNAREIYSATVSSQDQEVMTYEKFRLEDIPITRETWALQGVQNGKLVANDTLGIGEIKEQIAVLRKKNQALRERFIDEHPSAFASILVLQSMFLLFPGDVLERKFDQLDRKYKDSVAAKNLKTRIQGLVKTMPGRPVIPFSQPGLDGKMVDITALKGKVILIDFWGSWCVPCRKSHPDLKILFEKYHSRGLEIIGVANEIAGRKLSKELQDAAWRKAIQEDGINWLHVLYDPELTDIVQAYDVSLYPTKFLIDQNGNFSMKIQGNSPQSHEMLVKKLEELLPDTK